MKIYDVEGFPYLELPDGTAFAGLAFADVAKIEIPSELENLTAWRRRVMDRPSIAG